MEELQSRKILHFLFFFSFIFLFCSVFSYNYSLPDQHFINCGSASDVVIYGRTFTGDRDSRNFALSSGTSTPIEEPSSSTINELYQTARIFRKPSWYELDIFEYGTYVVRFHSFAFPSLPNPSNARFSVIASGFSLVSNFSVHNSSRFNSPLVEEFLLNLPVGKFRINFVPYDENSFAFVNAMEVFLAPPNFIRYFTANATQRENNSYYDSLFSGPLRVIHRINVGGEKITPDNDTLFRTWIPDDDYLLNKYAARNSDPYDDQPNYDEEVATMFDAPDFVYRTAKELNIRNNRRLINPLWRFNVKKGRKHFVRTHFCDIVSSSTNENLSFNLFIYGGFDQVIRPYDRIPQTGAPFYNDFLVDTDDSGFVNISIGPRNDSRDRNAFLNGVEIMEIVTELGSEPRGIDSTRKRLFIIMGSSIAVLILVLIILAAFLLILKRKKWKPVEAFDWPLVPLYGGSSHSRTTDKTITGSPLLDLNLGLKVPYSEILLATKNFDPKLVIGEGGFGKVYKGILRNHTKVAVKRSEPGNGQGLPEFQTEILILSKIRHNHLVSLVGYCDERDEMILMYEFMEKGTLRDHLYFTKEEESKESISRSELSWDERLKICIGAAKGVHYLHTGSNGAIIHRDIKSTNILLDERYVAKVADFGLSRSGPRDQTHVSTVVKGSFGYLDPEYFRCLQLTQKSDVYSFGVVLLEVLCARPAIDHSLPRDQINLAEWGMSWQTKGELEKIIDPFLDGKIYPNSLRKFGETVGKCLQECGDDRPNMVDVLWDLEYSLQLQHSMVPGEAYEDTSTDMWDLPSQVIPLGEDGILDESFSIPDANQVSDSEVFSQLKIHEAR